MVRAAWLKSVRNWMSGGSVPRLARQRNLRKAHSLVAEVRMLDPRVMLSTSAPDLWTEVDSFSATAREVSYLNLTDFTKLTMNESAMRQTLDAAPDEAAFNFSVNTNTLTLVNPDGNQQRFAIYETAMMAPELAAQFPEIKTYSGQGIDDPTATVQLDLTPQGFHAQVLSAGGRWYVDPYFHLNDDFYASYYAKNAVYSAEQRGGAIGGDTHDHLDDVIEHAVERNAVTPRQTTTAGRSGTQLRTYRAAVAGDGEYTQFHGGTVAAGQAAIVTAMNRVSGIYENELSIRMTLVANNSSLVYTNPGTDPYTNNNPGALLSENQTNIDNVIGNANYDIGHVFTTGGGGLAGLGVVGIDGTKAWGETGLPSPVGDPFYVDYVAHEMGHQFGGNHTFNQPDSNRNASTAYEPGSGSTIQAYAGLFGVDDLQSNSDAYFHSVSFDEMIAHVDTVIPNVGTRTATGNSVPTVDAGANFTIPASTPFVLTASGNDADGNGSLTYNWEQRDLGPAQTLSEADNGTSPLFRSFTATSSPSRTFPSLSTILTGTPIRGERLPTTTRTMNFRATVRDNNAGGGGVNTDDMVVNVVNTGAAFAVTSQNAGGSFVGATSQIVTWNVAGTTANGINTANVRILLSTDGGNTFGTVISNSTANDGTETIALPNLPTTQARIRVEAVGNIFFDITDANFTITAGINNDPTVNDAVFTVNENVPSATVVGTVVASDPDAGQTLTYAITAGNNAGAFAINSNGQIVIANPSPVNFEANPTFTLTVQVTDDGIPNRSDTATVTVNLNDINEVPTVGLLPSSFFLDENTSTAGGLSVSTVSITDDALGNEALSLTGPDASVFEIVGNNLRIKSGTALNFESKSQYSVTVNVNDPTVGGNPDSSQAFNLFVVNVNEAPVIGNQSFGVPLGSANGTAVGTVLASDPEGTALGYALVGGNTGGAFALNPANGQLTVASTAAVSFANSPFSLNVQVTDGTFVSMATVTVTVGNPNAVPAIGGAVANQAMNDTQTRAVFSTLTVTDADTQSMSATVNIQNGVVRGDFTPATTAGWTRTVVGNDLRYSRTFPSTANIGSVVQTAIRALVFQPRSNAIKPATTETTVFAVTVSDGVAAPVSNATTSAIVTSVNDAPIISGTSTPSVNDNATVNPFASLVVTDPDFQEGLAKVTILNGVARGDFTNAISSGWTREVTGNNITYARYFNPSANMGSALQAAYRALTFQPRQNAIRPGTTELTDFLLIVSDGVAAPVSNQATRVTTVSVNNVPTISGAAAGQTMTDAQTRQVFSTLVVTDPDLQALQVRVTISNGNVRGDFTPASSAGWTRIVVGNDIRYERAFPEAANNGAAAQAAVRALVFQPRNNVPVGTTETTVFTVFVNDGLASATNSTTSVITTGVAPRPAANFLAADVATVVLATVKPPVINPLSALLKRKR